MDIEPDNTIEEIIESAASYWQLDAGAYVLKKGRKVFRGGQKVSDAEILEGDILELIPDPEGGKSGRF